MQKVTFFSKYKVVLRNYSVIYFILLAVITSLLFLKDLELLISNPKIIILYYLISLSALYGIFISIDQEGVSLNKTYNIFTYFFFGLAPFFQFKAQSSFFGSEPVKYSHYIEMGFIILSIQLIYFIIYRFFYLFFQKKKINLPKFKVIINGKFSVLVSLISCLIFLYLAKFNFEMVVFRRPPSFWLKDNTNLGLLGYTLLLIVRGVPIYIFVLYILDNGFKLTKYLLFLLFLALLTTFPLSLLRSELVNYYLPFCLIVLPFLRKGVFYSSLYLVGVFFIFPLMNFFRHSNNQISFGAELFTTAHFDAFHNFSHLYNDNIVSNGKQLLGSLLFFIQKDIWPNKPVGTGQMLAELKGFNYTNISMPLWGEGYVNFGFVGIFIFLVLIVLANSFLDVVYKEKKGSYFFLILYLFLLGFEFYLLRGDLFSSVKILTSFLLMWISLQVVFCVFHRIKNS